MLGQPQRRTAFARRDLKDVAMLVVVVGDHVENKNARHLDAHSSFHNALGQRACAEAVSRELLTGEMDKPDVALQQTLPAQLEKDRRGQQQGRSGGVIVVRAM